MRLVTGSRLKAAHYFFCPICSSMRKRTKHEKKAKAAVLVFGLITCVPAIGSVSICKAKAASETISEFFVLSQNSTTKSNSYNLTRQQMGILFHEVMSPAARQLLAGSPAEKKKFTDGIKKLLAIAQAAENKGYGQRPEVVTQIAFSYEVSLNKVYKKKHPDFAVTQEQVNAYYQSHPNDFNTFLQSNPSFQQQAQGAQREALKKQYAEFRIFAELARKEKLDELEATNLDALMERSQILHNAYLTEMEEKEEKLVSGEAINQYYNEHKIDFEEVRVRHILIAFQQKPPYATKPEKRPKGLTRVKARRKAQALLVRARMGENFANLAKQNSDDPGSKDKGGEYDFFPRGYMVQSFEDAAFSLKPGQISGIVETPYGFHIIKVEQRRSPTPQTNPNVRERIIKTLAEQKIKDWYDEIVEASGIVIPEDFDTTIEPPKQAKPKSSGP